MQTAPIQKASIVQEVHGARRPLKRHLKCKNSMVQGAHSKGIHGASRLLLRAGSGIGLPHMRGVNSGSCSIQSPARDNREFSGTAVGVQGRIAPIRVVTESQTSGSRCFRLS